MFHRVAKWIWSHKKLSFTVLLLLGIVGVNGIAYMHAYAMTHFVADGVRTANPEQLAAWEKLKVLVAGVNIPRPINRTTPTDAGHAFESHTLQSTGGITLEVWHVAHPRPSGIVLLFHGYSAAKSMVLGEATALHELGFDTVLVDFRGSGGSGGNQTTIGVYEADDVAAVYEYARRRWPDKALILFGQSMGSAAILRAVAVHRIVPDALILECPFDRLLATVENRFTAMHLPSLPLAQLLVFWGGIQNDFNGFEHNPVTYAESVTCPTLLLHGADDARVTRPQADAIFARLGGEKRFHAFDGVGHRSYLATDPQAWKRVVGDFLNDNVSPPN